jgi:hypothetical protein
MIGGRRYRLPIDDFAVPRMKVGDRRKVKTKSEAKRWHDLLVGEILAGADPLAAHSALVPRCLDALVEEYEHLHCEANQLHMSTLKPLLGRVRRFLGDRDLHDLERPALIESIKSDLLAKGLEKATVNRYLAQLRHMTNWAIGRGYLKTSPFFHKLRNPAGIRLLKGETIRTRRLKEGEEDALLTAADQLYRRNCTEHEHIARSCGHGSRPRSTLGCGEEKCSSSRIATLIGVQSHSLC